MSPHFGPPSNCVCKKDEGKGMEEYVLMGPNIKLVNTVNLMYIQKLNLNELKEIFQKLNRS